ncbi:hypothetical protein [Rubripirellula reticaptiva]|uniref:Secreted protein n=1 Tax=Rubripirellula reticaptiva TaxID=2528013 RepID=A0A5C6FBB9_9BACT|nr:hypothetical protein [Rubripirellula reticaptiva]TWU57860.1 hypothetical protein Poly59_07690 [Rubripirellula reticaptiva]
MKKVLPLFAILTLTLALSGCGSGSGEAVINEPVAKDKATIEAEMAAQSAANAPSDYKRPGQK